VLYKTNVEKMFSVLQVSKEKISDKMIKSVEERVTSVSDQKKVGIEELYQALMAGFTDGKEYSIGGLSPKESALAARLCSRYFSREWNMLR
jgi:lipoate---protein ligase